MKSFQRKKSKMESGPGKFIATILSILVLLGVVLSLVFGMAVTVNADEIVVKQGIIDGKIEVFSTPGLYCQCMGKITTYKKSSQFWFSKRKDEGKDVDESISVRFNDGGHGQISGSISFNMPTDYEAMKKINSTYGSYENVIHRLLQQVVNKSVYMAGPLMSSKESAGDSRADLINYISDQIAHGVYKTEKKETKVTDVLTGQDRTVTIVRPAPDPTHHGIFLREEKSPIEEFGIQVYNLTINNITYDADVEKQIQAQQQAVMMVQTQMAKAKEAEQRILTVEKEGMANAAKAKWEQEVEKSKAITAAEQARDVQKLALETAELKKKENIALGEGEAQRKKLVMAADGALEQKLSAYVEVSKVYAAELGKQRWVPDVVIGSNGTTPQGTDFMNLLIVKAAKDLALDMKMTHDDKSKK